MFLAGEPMKSVMKVTMIGIQKEHTSEGGGKEMSWVHVDTSMERSSGW